MPAAPLRLIKSVLEYREQSEVDLLDKRIRGIYILYKEVAIKKTDTCYYDVVYVGMTKSSIRGRLLAHIKHKGSLWTHFSYYEVWDNIQESEIAELEGLIRHIYRFDSGANIFNKQGSFKKLSDIRRRTTREWEAEKYKD